jgi:hypothetical protein
VDRDAADRIRETVISPKQDFERAGFAAVAQARNAIRRMNAEEFLTAEDFLESPQSSAQPKSAEAVFVCRGFSRWSLTSGRS